nr:hypothetical protein [Tanacetum cinerariifolium]GEV43852.1 hypothetical protein [Tanacetum cinerariifolium]
MYHKKNVDYAYLLWEDLVYQVENKNSKKNNDMCYPCFTKVIIDYFMSKDQSISRRNKMFWQWARDDSMFNTIRVISRHQDTQVYGAILHVALIYQEILDSKAYKEYYAIESRAEPLKAKTKYKKKADESVTSPNSKTASASKDKGTGTIPGVPDVPPYEFKSDKESWGDSEDEDDNDDDGDNDDDAESDDYDDEINDKRIESDSDEIYDPNLTNVDQTEYEEVEVDEEKLDDEETMDDEEDDEVFKELYEDVNVNLEKEDNKIASLMETAAPHATTIPKITSGFTTNTPPLPPFFNPPLQQQTPTITTPTFTTTISTNPTVTLPEIPNFASIFKFNQRVDSTMKKIIKDQVKEQVSKMMPKIEKYVIRTLRAEALVRKTNQPQIAYAVAASLSEFKLKKILIEKMEANKSINRSDTQKNLYNALVESYNSDKDIITSYDRGMKRRKSGKYAESSKNSKSKEKKSLSTSKDASQSQHKSFVKSIYAEEPSHTIEESGVQQDQEIVTRDNDEQPIDKERRQIDFRPPQTWITQVALAEEPPTSFDEFNDTSFDFSAFVLNRLKILNLTQEILVGPAFNLEYHFKECSKAIAERLDWHNLKNKPYSFDLRKPFLLIQDHRGHQIIPKDYFINKDMEFLKVGDSSKRYSTSEMKTKAATYELKGIEDLVPEWWSPMVMNYDQHAYFGTLHWGPKRQSFYGYASYLTSSKDVYSRKRIIAVTRLTIIKKYNYDHLEEIEVRQDDQQLYKFKEGVLNDLHNWYQSLVALDLGFKGFLKYKGFEFLILLQIRVIETLTAVRPSWNNIHGFGQEEEIDELYKFSDGTLNDVRTTLHDIVAGIRMEYLPMRKWSNLDKK